MTNKKSDGTFDKRFRKIEFTSFNYCRSCRGKFTLTSEDYDEIIECENIIKEYLHKNHSGYTERLNGSLQMLPQREEWIK